MSYKLHIYQRTKIYGNLTLHFLLLLIATGCTQSVTSDNNDILKNEHSSYYKKKYSQAILHYNAPKDSLKLKALLFILNNLEDQFFLQADWIVAYDKAIFKLKNKSIDVLNSTRDSIINAYPEVASRIKDESVITNSYLIENIDNAFEARKYKWSNEVDFHDFCEYVLPYKVGNEKPERWGLCLNSEAYLNQDSIKKLNNVFEVASYVNNHLNWFQTSLNYDYPIDGGYNILKSVAVGTCNSESRMAAYEMRALGLPIAIDYAPSWGNRSNGHHWNVLIYKKQSYPFDPMGPNIGFYKIEFKGVDRMSFKISKVYRKTFAIENSSLAALQDSTEEIPTQFKSKRMKDVTSEYVPVSDVTLRYNRHLNAKFAYLCTFNNVDWTPSYWGQFNNDKVTFKNMGRDVAYLPALYTTQSDGKNVFPIGNPFILRANGKIESLIVNENKKQTLILKRKYPEDETNKISVGDQYELLYWNISWKSLGVQFAKSNILIYANAPTNALFWVRDLTKGREERIFTYENNKQVWW